MSGGATSPTLGGEKRPRGSEELGFLEKGFLEMALYADPTTMVYLRTSNDEENSGRYNACPFSRAMLVSVSAPWAGLAAQA